ncbi:MAG TPA: hypothetical protein VFZ08_08860 [Terriglobia bacterium]|nr:hypothetical protein [Terriglobia bacterium]
MRALSRIFLVTVFLTCAGTLLAQQACRGFSVIANSPEDKTMTAATAASTPQAQLTALDSYAQAHSTSSFMPCIDEYYAMAYLKLGQYDKVVEYGQKALASHDNNLALLVSLAKGYVGAGQPSADAFAVIMKTPPEILVESKGNEALPGKDITAYMEYAFYSLLARVTNANQRVQYLDEFTKAYPGGNSQGRADFQYFIAYKMLGNNAKAAPYGEKAVAEDPNNIDALNLVAYDDAVGRTNLRKAAEYAQKVLEMAPQIKKPDSMTSAQFQSAVNGKLGLAHLTLGYVDFVQSSRTRRIAPAIDQLKTASSLLEGNPQYQAQALYYLGNAYEYAYPPNHRAAAEALERAAQLPTPWKSQARELLAKVRAAERHR